jgi:hypothetical protein
VAQSGRHAIHRIAMASYPSFIGVSEANEFGQAFNHIAQALVDGRAQFLFGAGMSRESGLPVGSDLAKALLEQFFPKSGGSVAPSEERLEDLAFEFPFEAIVHAVEQKPGCKRSDLTKALKKLLVDPNPSPNAGHDAFLSLLGARPRVKAIFTTNYDTLFEQALGPDLCVPITEKDAAEIGRVRDVGKIPIIYLRGKLDGDYQITEPEVVTPKFQLLTEEFKSALHYAEAFVFVGFSLNDMDFRQFYFNFQEQLKARNTSGKTTYFVSPPKDEFSYSLGCAIWKLRQALWIPLDGKSFFVKLKDVVESRAVEGMRTVVKAVYNVNDAELDDLIDRMAKVWRANKQDALVILYDNRTLIGGKK